jgi:hypothetical protein
MKMLAPQKQFRMVPDHESGNNLKQKSNQNFTMRFQETVSTELNMLMRLTQISDRISGEKISYMFWNSHNGFPVISCQKFNILPQSISEMLLPESIKYSTYSQ